jgi:hypothetical protein
LKKVRFSKPKMDVTKISKSDKLTECLVCILVHTYVSFPLEKEERGKINF